MKRVRVGIIGYGLRGEILAAACRRSGEIEVTAVCDGGEAVRKKARADFPRARIFDDYTTLFKKGKIDAVLIETVIPAGNGLDFRTDPASSSRVFSGRGFRTAAARAWNATIPAIGHAAPAEPGRAAASAGRGRRGH